MVQKILGFLYRETHSLNQAAILLGTFAFLSQILGFLRDRLLAHIFGASLELDIYYAAFRIPDFIFVSAASVVSLSVLVPFIIDKENEGPESLRKFVNSVFSFFSVLILFVSVAAYFLMPFLSSVLFKNFSPDDLERVVSLSRLLLLSPIILGFSNLFSSLIQAYNRFTIYALAPLLYNAGIVVGIILLADRVGVLGVAIGVVVGAALHALVQVPFLISRRLLPIPSLDVDFSLIKKVVMVSLPRTLTLSMSHISLLFLVSLASLMSAGSISILSLSNNLQSVPLSIIGVSYSLAAFPTLSRRFKEKSIPAFIDQMTNSARFIIFWSLPITALFIVLRAQIVRVILGSGLFSWSDTRLTAAALALFVFSSMFQSLLLLLMRGFYSAGSTSKPFYINIFSTLVTVALSYSLVKLFYFLPGFGHFVAALLKVDDLPRAVVLMLPLAFSVGVIINTLIHWIVFERDFGGFSAGVMKTLFQSFAASVLMGFVAYLGLNVLAPFIETTFLFGIFLQGFLAGIAAIIFGIVVLVLLKNQEIKEV